MAEGRRRRRADSELAARRPESDFERAAGDLGVIGGVMSRLSLRTDSGPSPRPWRSARGRPTKGRWLGIDQAGRAGQLAVGLGRLHGYVLRARAWGVELVTILIGGRPDTSLAQTSRWVLPRGGRRFCPPRSPSTAEGAPKVVRAELSSSVWRGGQSEDLDARPDPRSRREVGDVE